jgi:hypothetical protein
LIKFQYCMKTRLLRCYLQESSSISSSRPIAKCWFCRNLLYQSDGWRCCSVYCKERERNSFVSKVTSTFYIHTDMCNALALVFLNSRVNSYFLIWVSTAAARSKAWTVFARSDTGIVGSNLTHLVCVRLFCVWVALCLGSGLETGWSPVQGVLPSA